MALNFPNSPTDGQIYTDSASGNRWSWDSANTVWKSTGTFTQTITVSSTAPGSPVVGQLWWNQDFGRLLVYYNDGTSSQWVDASPSDYTSGLAFGQANTVFGVANAAFGKANNALANTTGTFAGTLSVTGSVGVGYASPLSNLHVASEIRIGRTDATQEGGELKLCRSSDDAAQYSLDIFGSGSSPQLRMFDTIGGTVFFNASPTGVNYIRFNPTQSASGDANALDDYEEGTWSPTITQSTSNPTGITYTRQQGVYIKIGTFVYLSFNLLISAITNGSGFIRISNLPFTSANLNEADRSGMTINYCSGFTSTTSPTGGIVIQAQNAIELTTSNSADTRDNRATYCTNTGTSINLYGTLMYRASA